MPSRRAFLRQTGAAAFAALAPDGLARLEAAGAAVAGRSAEEVARDETYWADVQQAFTLDRTIINLNNGGVCPSPRVVHEALKRYLDLSNQAPAYHMWQILEPNLESVRRQLAAEFGCDPEELAVTRNASEALQIAQLGVDLAPGDEVLTTNQDYPRMLDTWEQRVRRDRIKLVRISFPVPADQQDLLRRFERAITPRTKVIHFCHITNLTGQIFPVREICELARARGILTIVDGAHAFAHFKFDGGRLGCDCYGTSLHKWLLAPVGTGFLYVRRDLIPSIWPLTPAPEKKTKDIRKFEEIGTHPAANHNAIAEALAFHHAIGIERKEARLRYLRDRWATRLQGLPRVKLLTSLEPGQAAGLATVSLEGLEAPKIVEHLWSRWRIFTTAIVHAEYQGVRVTPNVYTTIQEIDTFTEAMEQIARKGLPST
ncbi:MAG TPA: aminotransferase class V-fold PLP-dependent enzyme [Vicinamibacterales bacterium]|nr:aminotransferase class V-fold PLP-dependent enzyme [Vicinamibacterales bacterium]